MDAQYNLELDKAIKEIKKEKAKLVCLQFPRGLASKATEIASLLEKETKCKCLIWVGPTFGACDLPNFGALEKKIDLLIHFGHSTWKWRKAKN